MKRPSCISTKVEEDIYDPFSSTAPNSGNTYLDDPSSPYHNNAALSDTDSISDSSRKIRKKRNTYQKISDDIRIMLLEAVQKGETLKAAAKRHKINYSSAKSILHTYRKEGRILKKSAQERTTKKKGGSIVECEQPQKNIKSSKKENVQPSQKNDNMLVSSLALGDRIKYEPTNNGSVEEGKALEVSKILNGCPKGLTKIEHNEHHEDDNNMKSSTKVPTPRMANQIAQKKKEETVTKTMPHMDAEEFPESHYMGALEGFNSHRMSYTEENAPNRLKLFDNFYTNYFDAPIHEHGVDHMLGEHPEGMNFIHPSREFDPFSDMVVTSLHNRSTRSDSFSFNPNFMVSRGFNMQNALGDKTNKIENGAEYDYNGEFPSACPLKSFMDTQNLFREALRKASLVSHNDDNIGCRKGSIDFF